MNERIEIEITSITFHLTATHIRLDINDCIIVINHNHHYQNLQIIVYKYLKTLYKETIQISDDITIKDIIDTLFSEVPELSVDKHNTQ